MTEVSPYTPEELRGMGLTPDQLPRHIAVIMDGNGRWARSRGMPRIEGHRRGVTSVRTIVRECSRIGIKQLTLYCLSHENWKRPPRELNMLLHLLKQFVVEERNEILRQGLQFSVIGRREGLGESVLKEVEKTIAFSQKNTGMHLCLAINYGSRQEITDAVREIAVLVQQGKLEPEQITEEVIENQLYTRGMTDPDLLIRTAGEMRISNYLLWQISYAELFVTEKCWPEFRLPELLEALRGYQTRNRRFGGLNDTEVG